VSPAPGRWLAWLLTRLLGEDAEQALGDLEESWRARVGGRRPSAHDRWSHWRELGSFFRPSVIQALRSGREGGAGRAGKVAGMLSDLRVVWRGLRRAPGFALLAVLTIGFGIAATTVVTGAVDGLVLNPFPFPDGKRLVGVGTAYPKGGTPLSFFEHLSPAEYQDIARAGSLERVVAWDMGNRQVTFGEVTENLFSGFWWGDAFPTLGMEPHLGRGFSAAELDRRERVAVLSYRVWRDRFGADSAIVGKPVLVNGDPYEVVGVMPPRTLIYGMDLWIPMSVGPEVYPRNRRQFQVLARLSPGATLASANAELEVIARQVERAFVNEVPDYEGWKIEARTWADVNVASLRPAALVLLGAVGFVMLLVSTNVATLLLGRSSARARELALRSALGAGRGRLWRQLITESLLLAAAGLALGVGLGMLGADALDATVAAMAAPLPGSIEVNGRVLAAAAVVALIAGLGFGTIPAIHMLKGDLQRSLQVDGAGTTAHASRLRLQRLLVGFEAALALAMLAGSGYLVHSFRKLGAIDPGFVTEQVLTMRLSLARERYPREAIEPFFATLRERVGALPGVRAVATASQFPPRVFGRQEFRLEGIEAPAGATPSSYATLASPSLLETLGLRLVAGRFLGEQDRPGSPLAAVVNQALVDRYYGGQSPIGRRILLGGDEAIEIVGVVASTRNVGLDQEPGPEFYGSTLQLPGLNNQMFLVVRTAGDPYQVLPAIRDAVKSIDADQPVYAIRTIEEAFGESQFRRRVSTFMLSLFGGFALVLAAVGVYGVVSYATSQRTREVGVRMALGASRRAVTRLFVRQAMLPVLGGAVLGTGVAFLIGRAMASLLFEVQPGDPLTLLGAALMLSAVGLLAAYVPARRASRLDPVRALRSD